MEYRRVFRIVACSAILATNLPAQDPKPIALLKGPHLFVDEHLIARSEGIKRKVISPQRFLNQPIVTGAVEHQNWQPFLTVLHDPAAPAERRFRMWYNADALDDPGDGEFAGVSAVLDSADGVHWPGPYFRLTSLPIDGRVRFGASVIDDGPRSPKPGKRFKMLYFDAGERVGPRVAFSGDGLQWSVQQPVPLFPTANGDDIWTAGYDPLRERYFLIGKTYAPFTWTNREGREVTASIRRYTTRFSDNFTKWTEPQFVFSPDEKDSGITQWYGLGGYLVRGDLILGFLRELRDDRSPAEAPPEAIEANTRGRAGLGASGLVEGGSGMGYTVLAWTRDGVSWHRDRFTDPFLEPDSRVGAWDHAMSWVGSPVPVGDEVYLYYAGYRWGHKYRHSVDRQIGLVKTRRDRFVARQAGAEGGTLLTRLVTLDADSLTVNIEAPRGEVRLQISDAEGRPISGFTRDECRPITGDALAAPVQWAKPLAALKGQTVRLEFTLREARLFAFETK